MSSYVHNIHVSSMYMYCQPAMLFCFTLQYKEGILAKIPDLPTSTQMTIGKGGTIGIVRLIKLCNFFYALDCSKIVSGSQHYFQATLLAMHSLQIALSIRPGCFK